MPVAIPVIAAVAGAAVTAQVGVAIGATLLGSTFLATAVSSLAGFAVTTGLNAVGSRAFAPNNHASTPESTAINLQSNATMVNTTIGTHKIVYGQAKVSGAVQDLGTSNSGPVPFGGPNTGTNLFRHFVVLLAGHEVEEIGTVYIDNTPVSIDSNGYVNTVAYSYYPASPSATTLTISSAVRSNEVVTVTTSSAHGASVGDSITVKVASDLSMNGDFVIASTPTSTTFTYLNGGKNASATGGTFTNNTISTSVNSYIRIKKHTGSVSQLADSDMVAEVPGWTTDCRLNEIAYLYVRIEYNNTVFSRGVPNFSAIVKGKKCFDPRDSSTAWTDNAALCTRDYMISDYGINCEVDEINDTYFSAAANICDESVTLTTGGTQSRYTCNGVLDTASTLQSNLNALVASMAGTITEVQGQYRCHAGAYDSPAGNITTSMLAGDVEVRYSTPSDQLFNAVKGVHVNPSLSYAATDFPPVTNALYETEDGGRQVFKDIQLPMTNHPEAAQRIAKILLEQARQGIQVNLPINRKGMQFSVWDTITYTDAARGWSNKVFRIKKCGMAGADAIMLSLQEESSGSYSWNSGEATVLDAAPDTNLPNPFYVEIPTGISYTSRTIATTGGDTVYNLVLQWVQHPDTFVANGGRIEIQYKLSSDTDWRPSFFVNGNLTFSDILTNSANVSYDLRIRAVSSLGGRSQWVELDNAIIGSSGGVTTSNDWGIWTGSVGATLDFGNWTTSPTATDDWGFFT
jgi:hypothetical protein